MDEIKYQDQWFLILLVTVTFPPTPFFSIFPLWKNIDIINFWKLYKWAMHQIYTNFRKFFYKLFSKYHRIKTTDQDLSTKRLCLDTCAVIAAEFLKDTMIILSRKNSNRFALGDKNNVDKVKVRIVYHIQIYIHPKIRNCRPFWVEQIDASLERTVTIPDLL